MAASGMVFDVSPGCVEDGPGLRTVFFLKGCRLDCPWCHNLEGKSFLPEIAFHADRCIDCGACLDACPREWPAPAGSGAWRRGCTACVRCCEVCPSRARRLVGRPMSVEDVVREAERDRDFMKGTGGGVTFSGGEPLAQHRFLFDCARALRARGIHVAVETSGFWPASLAAKLAGGFDLVLFDVKHVDGRKLRQATGRSCRLILANLLRLASSGAALELRLPLVPGFNDGPGDLDRIGRWLEKNLPGARLRIIPFHRLAAAKTALFGRPYPFAHAVPPGPHALARAGAALEARGLKLLR
jgi:pyruvate formate lyase activating enzyme